jgi:lysophospholipase L1-like esterase
LLNFLVGLSFLPASAIVAAEPARFEFEDGDRIVLLGDTLVERDQKYGYFETLLTLENPRKNLTVRNLGWSGDTVFGDARAGFGTQADGFRQLKEHVQAFKPTVVFVAYGMNESFEGPAGLPRFVSGLNTLLDVIGQTKARVILVAPLAHENLGPPLPDPAKHNKNLMLYRDAIEKIAAERNLFFVDLFDATKTLGQSLKPARRRALGVNLTDDGIHLNEVGYFRVARILSDQLTKPEGIRFRAIELSADGQVESTDQAKVAHVEAVSDRTGLRFDVTDESLPDPITPPPHELTYRQRLSVKGLAPGRYALKIDGAEVARADQGEWATGLALRKGPEFEQVERLRKTINEKNLLYFHRWRPQNETYLFGFRKHEQGNNAREIPLFDPLVEEKEKEIAKLRMPVTHVYELVRENEVSK